VGLRAGACACEPRARQGAPYSGYKRMTTGFSSSCRRRSSTPRFSSISGGMGPPGGMLCNSVVISLSTLQT